MNADEVFCRYQELQTYVGWTPEDAQRVAHAFGLVQPQLHMLIDDFYNEINRNSNTRKVITGGTEQIERLKGTLMGWLVELFSGVYDPQYVARRWRVGFRHVEIGLDQVYTNAALSRLRTGLVRSLEENWQGDLEILRATVRSLDKLLDLDLAIIEDAYQAEFAERLQRSERLAAIGQVAGGVAHELRNPLNVVKTSIYFLLNARNPSKEKQAEHLGRIEKQVHLADSVITALSNFARLPVPNMVPFSLEQCVREVLEYNEFPKNIEATLDIPATLPMALADPDQVRIVLSNLIRNALEAMPQGGRLTVTGQHYDSFLDLGVTDSGSGISPENLHHIMEPLFSTKARGLGLGLAIARSILEKNKGNLRVASTPGQGSTFTVRLHAAPPAEKTPHDREKP